MAADDSIQPTRIEVPDADLEDLRRRLAATRWPEAPTGEGWSQGVPLDYLRDLVGHWADGYDWRAREAGWNALPQVRTTIDGVDIHALCVRSRVEGAMPLVLTHGWPGSFVEFLDIIGPLTDPAAHGGDATDAFHVVIPSLPGYAWSGKPSAPGWGVERIADAWAELMGRLGFDRFAAQGGDWGSAITTALGGRHPDRVIGIHLNMVAGEPGPDDPPAPTPEVAAEEAEATAKAATYRKEESGYSSEQRTRPQTLGYALVDSPVGQCAWVLEKLSSWSDRGRHDPVGAFGADRVLDNVMTYWLPGTGASSARLYWESFTRSTPDPVEVPMGAAIFPADIHSSSQRWAARTYRDIRRWERMPRGGHFAALEEPELLVGEVRAMFAPLRH